MIQYSNFYRKFVVRNDGQLKQPPLPRLERFELPVLSMVHFVPQSATNLWPAENWFMYQGNSKPIRINNHVNLIEPVGGPKLVGEDFNGKIREFRSRNPRFRLALELEVMKREEKAIVTQNYGLLFARWKYQRSMFSNMNRWTNVFNTMFATAGDAVGSGYQQYLELTMPRLLPKRAVLEKSELGWNNRNMPLFNSYPMLMLHHLWMWLGENRHKGMIARQFKKGYKGVHLIMREGDRFCVIDLDRINQWRKPSAHETKEHAAQLKENPALAPLASGTYAPAVMQKAFLRLAMAIMETRGADISENLGDELKVTSATDETSSEQTSSHAQSDAAVDSVAVAKTSATVDTEQSEGDAFAGYDETVDQANLMAEIDKDLEALDKVGADGDDVNAEASFEENDEVDIYQDTPETPDSGDSDQTIAVQEVSFFPENPVDAFKEVCNRAAEEGNISASDYRRLLELGEQSKTIAAPLGVPGVIGDFIQIKPEDVLVSSDDPEIQIPDQATVIDKSMLKSTLQVMDRRYAEKILQKDVAGMVMQLQAAGIAVKSYQVREVEDITGAHYEYTVQIKPVEGAASTVMFKLPKVEEDGNFQISGTRYRLRKQRGDLPLRKIGPSKVALTSYYGKLFVERSPRRVNDHTKWLNNAIMAAGLDPKNSIITGLVPGRAWGPDMAAPRLFSSIAQAFRAFNVLIDGDIYACSWDATNVTTLRMKGSPVVVGQSAESGKRLLMDEDNNLIIDAKESAWRPAPSFDELLGLNISKAPVEFAELKVFAKMVPTGVVLSFLLGFDNLLKLLKPSHLREVPTGKRVGLTGDEWAIAFYDKSYVFSRSDKMATMVLGGWREFYQTTSRFSSEEFNKRDVYFNLFEEAKLGVRTMRELELLEQLFIDPITRELLRDMNEPVVFTKLLLRSCEMLTTDAHPNEQDTKFMRIKGYERFAGAVYAELVRSVRIHTSRPGKHRYGVELNPYAVWIGIQQDPAKDQVSEINPIQNLKEQEAVTYSGTGGRNSRSMVKSTRVYHKNDMGVISESTVDSGDVAINVFTSANPQFNSLRGTSDTFDFEEHGATALLSTSALVSPGSTKDD